MNKSDEIFEYSEKDEAEVKGYKGRWPYHLGWFIDCIIKL